MKKWFAGLTILLASLALSFSAHAAAREGYTPFAEAAFDRLTIVSFSEYWDEDGIAALYAELLQNVHGEELALLGHIYLYPDSPAGVAGQYFEDVTHRADGTLSFGASAYIELFNMDRRRAVADVAPVLSHEYGHHYTIINITAHERLYTTEWGLSQYGALRNLAAHPVSYGFNADYAWDVTEIAANDYVQLLGSPNARQSYDYPDAEEKLTQGNVEFFLPTMFNKRPQDNASLPLAAEVDGLYAYLLAIGGHAGNTPSIAARPVITGIMAEDSFLNPKYTLSWTAAEGNGNFEYTAIMFPAAYPFLVEPLKTVVDGETLSATFGTVTKDEADGSTLAVLDYYIGDYVFVIYAKDANGFMFASAPMPYSFGEDCFDTMTHLAALESEAIVEPEAIPESSKTDLPIESPINIIVSKKITPSTQFVLQTPQDIADITFRTTNTMYPTHFIQPSHAQIEPPALRRSRGMPQMFPVGRLSIHSVYGGRTHDLRLSYSHGKQSRL